MVRFKITLLFALVLLITPAYAQKQTAISYLKHAEADSSVALAGGQAVLFTAPSETWTLSGIRKIRFNLAQQQPNTAMVHQVSS